MQYGGNSFVNAGVPVGPSGKAVQFPSYRSIHGPLPSADCFEPKQTGSYAPRLQLHAILFSVFAPWMLFVFLSAVMSFSVHYHFPEITWFIQMAGFAPAILTAFLAFNTYRQGGNCFWYGYSTVAFGLAVAAAAAYGGHNFAANMMPYYEIAHLNTYPSVNPARDKGAQLMDAGAVFFEEGTGLDTRRAMGFKSGDLYCVAPIVFGDKAMASYDFWAIGKNCCSGVSSDFRCGDYNKPHTSAGLRLVLHEEERAFYKLAVQQASAAYKLTSTHPIFFHWIENPVGEANSWRDAGFNEYVLGVFGYLGFSFFCVFASVFAVVVVGFMSFRRG